MNKYAKVKYKARISYSEMRERLHNSPRFKRASAIDKLYLERLLIDYERSLPHGGSPRLLNWKLGRS